MKHCLKTIQPYFGEVENGTKTFEVRKNDRNFKVGDILFLQEFDGKALTGKEETRVVTYVLKDYPALRSGFVVLGIKEVEV
jgi:ASC-1-like (ASCH) protein